MAANKVFSSGGGGGGKGPAVIDKRSQELRCPYCDKVYTQANSARYKEHLANKHADQAQGAAAGGDKAAAAAPSSSSAATGAPAAGSGPAKPSPAPKDAGKAPSWPPPGFAAPGPSSSRPASSAVASAKPPGAAPSAGAPAAAAAAAAAPAGGGGMMDIGSKAGYYTSKSPKLQLLEWAQKEKLQKPRYSVRQAEGGAFTCKVVLPDPKRSDNDTVIFLDDAYAAPDAAEAEQRAAVVALHRMAGDRQMHMLLPPQYRDLWHEVKAAAAQRASAHAARAAAEEHRRQRERDKAARLAVRGPKAVVMSDAKQALLQSLLREGFAAASPGGGHDDGNGYEHAPSSSGASPDPALLSDLESQLLPMGFSQQHVRAAAAGVAGHRRLASGRATAAELALDWLFIYLAREQLPEQFTRGSKTNVVSVLATQSTRQAQAAAVAAGTAAPQQEQQQQQQQWESEADAVCRLGAWGYTPSECHTALARCGGDEAAALQSLYQDLTGTSVSLHPAAAAAVSAAAAASSAPPASWDEEVMVLEAIHGPEACQGTAAGRARVLLDIPSHCTLLAPPSSESWDAAADGGGAAPHLALEFFCPEDGGEGGGYPAAPPLVAVACAAMPAACLRRLTRRLARVAAAAAAEGLPMLHDLVTAAGEMLAGEWHLQQAQQQGDGRQRVALDESSSEEEEEEDEDRGRGDGDEEAVREEEEEEEEEVEDAEATAAAEAAAQAAAVDYDQQRDLAWDEKMEEEEQAAATAAVAAAVRPQRQAQGEQSEQGQGQEEAQQQQEAAAAAGSLVEGFDGLALAEDDGDEDEAVSGQQQQAQQPQQQQQRRKQPQPRAGGALRRAGRPALSAAEAQAENARLARHQAWLEASSEHASLRGQRGSLPAAGKRGELLAVLAANPVVVISGATGCGKSTQVPQYILEDAISGGRVASCNIIVTQPRRISALGLAARVAAERAEDVGNTVGYSVRLDSKHSVRTRLLFCTTGVLLRRLLSDPSLDSVSHVMLDEVHERSVEIDLLLLLLRDVAQARSQRAAVQPGAAPSASASPLRLVLMSATADAELFASYMQTATGGAGGGDSKAGSRGRQQQLGVGMLTIPGFTYPVREFYLEDVLERTGHVIGRSSRYAKKGAPKANPSKAGEPTGWWDAPELAQQYSETTRRSLSVVDEDQINYDALVDLLCLLVEQQQTHGPRAFLSDWPEATPYLNKLKAAGSSGGGAVLVFLPGAPEISRLQRLLLASEKLCGAAGGRGNLRVLPLHGSLSSEDQKRVFVRPPAGTIKLVLATNVAETSITIDDVSFVVDTGRAKEMTHDVDRGILRLQEGFVSQAAAQQRRGRAGRVRPGVCFRMFSRHQWSTMPSHTSPEMLRSPLEQVALLIKGMASGGHELLAAAAGDGGVARVLARCLSPPLPAAVSGATRLLRAIGAFDASERLTALGGHLNRMPMDPRIGKMLVYGAMLGCLDPVLTVAAALAHGRPVLLSAPPDQQAELARSRASLLEPGIAARSDHVVLVAVFNGWVKARTKGGRHAGVDFCAQYALSESSLEAVAAGRAEYAATLADLGFVSRDDADALRGGGGGRGGKGGGGGGGFDGSPDSAWLSRAVNRNWANARFLKAAVCAGFYPSVLRVQPPKAKFKQVEGGAFEVDPEPSAVKFFDRERGRAFMHPGSICFNIGRFDSGYLVYTNMTQTSKLFVREASMVPVYSLLLFGGGLNVNMAAGIISVDGWAEFKAPASVGVLVKGLRAELDAVLAAKIRDPGLELADSKAAAAVIELLSSDGF